MPVGFNSPARNFFLLGSSGDGVVGNFFKTIDQSAGTDGVYLPDEIRYNYTDQKYLLAGSAADSNSKGFGWFEKRDDAGVADFENRIEATQPGVNTTLRAMELDSNNNLIVVGFSGSAPWIAKYSNGGVIDWQSTTFSANVRYLDLTSDSNGNYYACGRTSYALPDTQAFVEKFDSNGNPGWGKSAFMLGRDVVLKSIAANSRGEVVAVGFLEDDSADKGYIVKIDTNTGEVLWDRTLSPDAGGDQLKCTDVYIDNQDQIYVSVNGTDDGYLVKYTPEGNMQWQRKTAQSSGSITYDQVFSDGETQQTVVFGTYNDGSTISGLLSKYSRNGDLVWRRTLLSSFNNSDTFSNVNLDADPSFYYVLYTDGPVSGLNGTPDAYTFGKVSSSGNGLGDFQYTEGTGETIDYEILAEPDKIGRLSDGSVRNDTSDLVAYPFGATKIMFDDLAAKVTNKKRQMDDADSFEYSGSPAIRPADFQELNLLGSTGFVDETIGSPTTLGAQTWSNDLTTANPNNGFEAAGPAVNAFDGGANGGAGAATSTTTTGNQIVWSPSQFPAANGPYTIEVIANKNGVIGGWGDRKLIVNGTTVFDPGVDPAPTAPYYITASNLTEITEVIVEAATTARSRLDEIKVNGTELIDGQGITLSGSSTTISKVKDQSGKGNDGVVNGATHNAAGYWEFDGTDNKIISGPKCNTLFEDGGGGTIEMWVKLNDVSPRQTLCSGYMTSGPTQPDRWDFEVQSGLVRGGFHDNGYSQSNPILNTNTWYNFMFVLDKSGGNGEIRFYIDGVEESNWSGSLTVDRDFATDVEFGIGNRYLQQTDFPLNGDVGEVRTYPRALTAAAVFQNYNASKSKYINEAPDTAPKIGPGIVYDNNLLLNYDFGNRATYDPIENLFQNSNLLQTTSTSIPTNWQGWNPATWLSMPHLNGPFGDKSAKVVAHGADNQNGGGTRKDVTGLVPGATYTVSAYVRKISEEELAYWNANNSLGLTTGTANGAQDVPWFAATRCRWDMQNPSGTGDNPAHQITLTDQWQRIERDFPASSDGNKRLILSNNVGDTGTGNDDGGGVFLIAAFQLERKYNTLYGGDNKAGLWFATGVGQTVSAPTTVKNLSSSSHTGTINGATFNSAGYFEFDGTTGQIDLDTSVQFNTGDFSLCAWVKVNSNPTNGGNRMIFGSGYAGSNPDIEFDINGSGAVRFYVRDSNLGGSQVASPLTYEDDTWHHVVGVKTSSGTELYVDGMSVNSSSNTLTGDVDTAGANSIIGNGTTGINNRWFDGSIGELQAYTKALTATEVSQNFNATRGKYGV